MRGSRAAAGFERLGWSVERRAWVLAALVGPSPCLPAFVAWGHPCYPRSRPLAALSGPLWRAAEPVAALCAAGLGSILLLEAGTDAETWRLLLGLLRAGPPGLALHVLGPQDLRRGILRRVAWRPLEAAAPEG